MTRSLSGLTFGLFALALSAHATAAGPDIVVGQIADLSGPDGYTGTDFMTGAKAYFDDVNADGGINGRQIRHVVIDSKGSPAKTMQAAQQLIEQDKADLLFGVTGTAPVTQLIRSKLLQKSNTPLLAPLTGLDALRGTSTEPGEDGFQPQVFHVRAGYAQEVRKVVRQALNLGMQRVAVFYSDDAFGQATLKTVEAELGKRQLNLVASSAKADAAATLAKAQPQAVIVLAETAPAARFVKTFRALMPGVQLFALSVVNPRVLASETGLESAQGVAVTHVVPSPFNPTTRIAKEHAAAMGPYQNTAPLSYATMEGYLAAKLLVDALRKAGPQFSRDKLTKTLETMGRDDLGGYELTFGPTDHRGSAYVELGVINKDGRVVD